MQSEGGGDEGGGVEEGGLVEIGHANRRGGGCVKVGASGDPILLWWLAPLQWISWHWLLRLLWSSPPLLG
jgi:hypothetical protein